LDDAYATCDGDLFLPIGVVPADDEPLSARRLSQLTWCLVWLGLAARVIRYLLDFPLWHDETFLCANLLNRGYAELLDPLAHHQVAPVLFLWIQATVIRLLGFSEYTLRLFPLICSVAGLFLFRHVASRLLRGTALLLAVGVFAVGYPLVRYACEAKPYGCDMFASLVLVALVVEWYVTRSPRWLWALTACVPLTLGLSYPTVFTAAGVSVAVAFVLWRERRSGWVAWLCYNVALAAGFAAVYYLSVGPQSAAELAWMRDYWKDIFPPRDSAVGLAQWFVVAHTSELLQYPVGGARGASTFTTICCAAAVVVLWRRRQWRLILLCLAPLVPNLVAALLWRYPYGGSVRFVLYMAPAVCLLAGLGAASLVVWRNRRGVVSGRTTLLILFVLLAAVAVGSIARDFARPYRTRDVLTHRDFARWFWPNKEYDAEVACWDADVPEGRSSPPAQLASATLYLCNRQVYSPHRAAGRPVAWSRISATHPLRVVRYSASHAAEPEPAFDRWLTELAARYDLINHHRHAFPLHYKDRDLLGYDFLDVYEFAPKGQSPTGI